MANKREFEIAFVGLKPGIHEFKYDLSQEFFQERGAPDFSNASAQVKLLLDKHAGFLMLKFEIGGVAEVSCDRCGNPLKLDLWDEFNMVVKLVDNPEQMNDQEEDPDIWYISRTDSHIDVSTWMYEFVLLSLPMQRMCSESEIGGPQCNKEVLEKLREMERKTIENNSRSLWKDLDKFKEN